MKLVTANKLNRLWKNGILPGLAKKIDATRVLTTAEQVEANTNVENLPSAVVVGELYNNLTATDGKVENIRVYVGSDKKIHFVNSAGADSALPFSSEIPLSIRVNHYVTSENKRYIDLYINNALAGRHVADGENHSLSCSYVARA